MLHWYDFVCPFCYVAQHRNAILSRHGLQVTELAFQAHPEIPPGGIPAGPRGGTTYAALEREAEEAGLPLRWPARLPNTRKALAAAEWVRQQQPERFAAVRKALFEAHFAQGEDIEDLEVIGRHAAAAGVELNALQAALQDGSAAHGVEESEALGLS